MFRIGDFSRLTKVSIKTLHHYDQIGLFQPVQVDPWTGYRYYASDQLPRLNRILALKGLGFTLGQICQMVDEDLSAEELRGMLRLRRAQLQQEIDEAREKLAQVEIRLNYIEREDKMFDIEILTKQVEAITIVGAREVVLSPDLMRERCMALEAEARQLINNKNLKTDQLCFALYYSTGEEGIEVEMAYAIEPSDAQTLVQGQASIHQLPAVRVAYAVYRGSYDDFGAVGQLHMAINSWLDVHGYRVVGPAREFYLRPPLDASDRTGVMEIQYPIEKT